MHRTHPHRWLAIAVALVAIGLVPIGATVASGEAAKDIAPRLPETATIPEPPEPADAGATASAGDPTTIAAQGDRCGTDGSLFTNPVMRYRLCVPSGWGFTDFAQEQAWTRVPSQSLDGLHLVGPDAFPWEVGTRPFDAIARAGLIDIELAVLERGVVTEDECVPRARLRVGPITVRSCEQAYDPIGLPSVTGPVQATKIVVPLPSSPELDDPLFDPSGAQLQVIIRSAPNAEGVADAWSIVDSIRVW